MQEGIYDEFLRKFTAIARELGAATGDPFAHGVQHGPQVSQTQFDVSFLPPPHPFLRPHVHAR